MPRMNKLLIVGLLLGHKHTNTFKEDIWRIHYIFATLMEHNVLLTF